MEAIAVLPALTNPVPPEYVSRPPSIDNATIDASLLPPSNVRLIVVRPTINSAVTSDDILGYFTADTPIGLHDYPGDFDVLGGRDSALFDRVPARLTGVGGSPVRSALHPSSVLVEQVNKGVRGNTWMSRTFELTVVGHDRFGATSKPANIRFSLAYGPPAQAPVPQETPLQRLARDIARIVDPKHTLTYFDAYDAALQEPSRCGAAGDESFVDNYRQAFEHAHPKLSASNIGAFYAGVCVAWRDAVTHEQAALAANQAARAAAIERNSEAEAAHAIAGFGLKVGQGFAVIVAEIAVVVFLLAALSLAFLALEANSRAIRDAMRLFAERPPT